MPEPTDTWGLFVVDGIFRIQRIQRIDENPTFSSDEEAYHHVERLALKGDTEALYAVLCHGETVETIRKLEDTMPDFHEKLLRYKTAYSIAHREFVRIVKVRYDGDGEPIIDTLMGEHEMMFRVHELTDFCL